MGGSCLAGRAASQLSNVHMIAVTVVLRLSMGLQA
jgi:hypothetical protein